MARRKGWRSVKKHLNYTINEAARNQGVSKVTVHRWIKSGLTCLKDARPHLILGHEFIAFLKADSPTKHPLAADEFFCFRCKDPRKPAFDEVEFRHSKPTSGKLSALCGTCTTVMHKSITTITLNSLKPVLHVSFPCDHETLNNGVKPL
jgi:hypothetical protein